MVGRAGIIYVMGLALIFGTISWNMSQLRGGDDWQHGGLH